MRNPDEYPILLSRSLAEQLTGIDVRELDKLRKNGIIRCYTTLGGQHRFHKSSLLQYIETKSTKSFQDEQHRLPQG
jgi:predicted site-specific integrase-resolvase